MFAICTPEIHILLNSLRIGQMNSVHLFHQSHPLAVDDGVVKVGCTDEFHLTTLKRSKEFLVESAQKIYGKKVRIEISLNPRTGERKEKKAELQSRQASTRSEEQAGQANAPRDQHSTLSTLDHPIIKALMRELGAEPLQ
jgi:chromosomal replication initiation ATPase DnaA